MTEHILITHATSYERPMISLAPHGCRYDYDIAAWIVIESGQLLVESPDRPKPQTKKNDIETGEDQKGE